LAQPGPAPSHSAARGPLHAPRLRRARPAAEKAAMAGIMGGDDDDHDKGKLMYQESKEFNSEMFLCSAYDNESASRITFEIYGLDTQDMYHLIYDYQNFNSLFRFNAELMNPTKKEGRFNWVIARLKIETLNSKRELKLAPDPTEEVASIPLYETQRKIPTGRMDLNERKKLRESMDMLDIRRAEKIQKRRLEWKQRALKRIMQLKEEDKLRKESVNQKIEEERKLRVKMKEERERREREEEARAEAIRKQRRKKVVEKETSTKEDVQKSYEELRSRWRISDEAAAKTKAEHEEKLERERQSRLEAAQQAQQHALDIQARREAAWAAKEERIRKAEAAKINHIRDVKITLERQAKLRQERNKEFLQLLHSERQPIFHEQLERTREREQAKESEREALENYKEKRAIPKKVNKKGRKRSESVTSERAPASPTSPASPASPTSPAKKGRKKAAPKGEPADTDGAATEGEAPAPPPTGKKKVDTEKVLDAIEAKMRKEMEEARRREMLQKKRDQKVQEKEENRIAKENEHMAHVRADYRQNHALKEEAAAERRLVMADREKEMAATEARQKQDRVRRDREREAKLLRKEQERFARLCAPAA